MKRGKKQNKTALSCQFCKGVFGSGFLTPVKLSDGGSPSQIADYIS
jgi:hypothetical protein